MHTDPFADISNDLEFGGPVVIDMAEAAKPRFVAAKKAPTEYSSPCKKCGGSGRVTFGHYFQRSGTCFACKGAGHFVFKTSPEQREKAREQAAARKERTMSDNLESFAAAEPAMHAWLVAASRRGFEFATNLLDAVARYGSLTENQLQAVYRCMQREEAEAEKRREAAMRQANGQKDGAEGDRELGRQLAKARESLSSRDQVFADSLMQGLAKYGCFTDRQRPHVERLIASVAPAQPGQAPVAGGQLRADELHRVLQNHAKFYVGDVTISRKNADQLCWIKHANSERVVGKIDGGVVTLWKRDGVDQDELRSLISELDGAPLQAAMKYGKLAGRCCSCGRELTDPDSIESGIGPVCATKFA